MWHMKHESFTYWKKNFQPSGKKKPFPPYMYKKKILHLLKSPPPYHFSDIVHALV